MNQVDKEQNSSSSITPAASSTSSPVSENTSNFGNSNRQSASASTSNENDNDEIQIIFEKVSPYSGSRFSRILMNQIDKIKKKFLSHAASSSTAGKSPEKKNLNVDECSGEPNNLNTLLSLMSNPHLSARFLNDLQSRIDFNISPDISSASPKEVSQNTANTFEENNEKMTQVKKVSAVKPSNVKEFHVRPCTSKVSLLANSKDSEIASNISLAGTSALKDQRISESTENIFKKNDGQTHEKNTGNMNFLQVSSVKKSCVKKLKVHPSTTKVSSVSTSISTSISTSVLTSVSTSASTSVSTSTFTSTFTSTSTSYQTTNIHEGKNSQSASASTSNENKDGDDQVALQQPVSLSNLMVMSCVLSREGNSTADPLTPNVGSIFSMFQEMVLKLCFEMYVILNGNEASTVYEIASNYETMYNSVLMYKMRINELKEENDDLMIEKDKRENLIKEMKKEIENLKEGKKVIGRSMHAYKINTLNFRDKSKDQTEKVRKELQICRREVDQLQCTVKEKEERLRSIELKEKQLQDFLKEKDDELQSFNLKLLEKQRSVKDKEEKLQYQEQKVKELESTVNDTDRQLSASEDLENLLESYLTDKDEKITSCEEEMHQLENAMKSKEEKIMSTEEEAHQLEMSLKNKDERLGYYKKKLNKLKLKLKDKDENFHNAEQEVNLLQTLLEKKDKMVESSEQRINQLQNTINLKDQQYNVREKEICEIYTNTKDKEFKMQTMERRINEMQALLVDKEKELLSYDQEVNQQVTLLNDKSKKISQIKYEIENLKKENEILKKAKENAINSSNNIKIDCDKVIKCLDTLKHQINSKKMTLKNAGNQTDIKIQLCGSSEDEDEKVLNLDFPTCLNRNLRTVECQTELSNLSGHFFPELCTGNISEFSDFPEEFLTEF